MTPFTFLTSLLLLAVLGFYTEASPLAPTRRDQDIVVIRPQENVIGPAFSHSYHGEQTVYNGAQGSGSQPDGDPPQALEEPHKAEATRRDNDMFIMNPYSDSMYGQQFYGSSSEHNAPLAIASGHSVPTRREQDIVVFKPKENVIGPAFSSSHHGEQTIYKGAAAPEQDSAVPSRRDNDMFIVKPYTDALYGQQFYGSSSQHNAPTAIATGSELPGVPTRRDNDMFIVQPYTDALYGQQFYGSSSQHNAPTAIATGSELPGVPTRRDNDMFIVKPYTDALYGQQFYGSSSQHNAPTAIATGSQLPGVPTRRDNDMFIVQPYTDALYGQQFYGSSSQHNAPTAIATGSGLPARRSQDIVIIKPQSNVIGPAFGSSYHGEQVIHKEAHPAANDEAKKPGEHSQQGSTDPTRRNNDMFIVQPYTDAMYGQQFYGSSSQHNAPTAISTGSLPTRKSQDIVVYRPEDNVIGPAFSQSYHGEQVIFNAPHQAGAAEDEFLIKSSGRREQDIVVFQPTSNVIGPAFGESYYGNQLIQN